MAKIVFNNQKDNKKVIDKKRQEKDKKSPAPVKDGVVLENKTKLSFIDKSVKTKSTFVDKSTKTESTIVDKSKSNKTELKFVDKSAKATTKVKPKPIVKEIPKEIPIVKEVEMVEPKPVVKKEPIVLKPIQQIKKIDIPKPKQKIEVCPFNEGELIKHKDIIYFIHRTKYGQFYLLTDSSMSMRQYIPDDWGIFIKIH